MLDISQKRRGLATPRDRGTIRKGDSWDSTSSCKAMRLIHYLSAKLAENSTRSGGVEMSLCQAFGASVSYFLSLQGRRRGDQGTCQIRSTSSTYGNWTWPAASVLVSGKAVLVALVSRNPGQAIPKQSSDPRTGRPRKQFGSWLVKKGIFASFGLGRGVRGHYFFGPEI